MARKISRPALTSPTRVWAALVIVVFAILIAAFVLTDREVGFELPGSQREAGAAALDAAIGATLEPLDRSTAESLGVPARNEGLVVTSLGENGPAAQAGLRSGDVIERIGGFPVGSLDDAAAALAGAPTPFLNLLVNRRGEYVILRLPTRSAPATPDPATQGGER